MEQQLAHHLRTGARLADRVEQVAGEHRIGTIVAITSAKSPTHPLPELPHRHRCAPAAHHHERRDRDECAVEHEPGRCRDPPSGQPSRRCQHGDGQRQQDAEGGEGRRRGEHAGGRHRTGGMSAASPVAHEHGEPDRAGGLHELLRRKADGRRVCHRADADVDADRPVRRPVQRATIGDRCAGAQHAEERDRRIDRGHACEQLAHEHCVPDSEGRGGHAEHQHDHGGDDASAG